MDDTPPRLMLISPVLGAASRFRTALEEALESAEFAALVLRVQPGPDERGLLAMLKPLVEVAQEKNVAVLIEGAPDLVGKSGADGVHAQGESKAQEAVERFKPDNKIVGVGGLRTRDAAMTIGERGADYVLFGDPGKGGEIPLDAVTERIEWWVDIFTTPCVGQAETLDAVAPIAKAGPEFVAFGGFVWCDPKGPANAVGRALALLPERAFA